MSSVNNKQLRYLEYMNRENNIRHHRYDEEMKQYAYLKEGNLAAIEESVKMLSSPLPGHLSDSPLRNIKYLFVASITLATRSAIEGDMEEEEAYNASDLYIQQMDICASADEVKKLHKEMFIFFTKKIASLPKGTVFSKPIILCMDYIDYHLHEKITIQVLAEFVDLNPNYLSTLFKKETKQTISECIEKKKIKTAENMLKYSEYSYSEIATTLAFSSQGHFNRVFKKNTGYTPREYQQIFFRKQLFEGEI